MSCAPAKPPLSTGYAFFLDYGMKAGALDHEKETILRLHRSIPPPASKSRICASTTGSTSSTPPEIRTLPASRTGL